MRPVFVCGFALAINQMQQITQKRIPLRLMGFDCIVQALFGDALFGCRGDLRSEAALMHAVVFYVCAWMP